MQENLPVERLVRKALRAEEPIGRPGIRQLGIPQGAKRLEERWASPGPKDARLLGEFHGWAGHLKWQTTSAHTTSSSFFIFRYIWN